MFGFHKRQSLNPTQTMCARVGQTSPMNQKRVTSTLMLACSCNDSKTARNEHL